LNNGLTGLFFVQTALLAGHAAGGLFYVQKRRNWLSAFELIQKYGIRQHEMKLWDEKWDEIVIVQKRSVFADFTTHCEFFVPTFLIFIPTFSLSSQLFAFSSQPHLTFIWIIV
jgi:hypothetical protein